MNEIEARAHELLRLREWVMALDLFDQLINQALAKGAPKERVVFYLLGRSECLVELGRHEAVVSDCRKIIKLLEGANTSNNGARVWRRLVNALFSLQRFGEAETAAAEWIAASGGLSEAVKLLEQVRILVQLIKKKDMNRSLHQVPQYGEESVRQDFDGELWNGYNFEEMKRNRKHPVKLIESDMAQNNLVHFQNLRLTNHEQFTIHQNISLPCEGPAADQGIIFKSLHNSIIDPVE